MSGTTEHPRCTFCTKPHTQVARLVAGPGVYICDECIGLCTQILEAHQSAERVERIVPWEAMSDDQLLEHVPRIAATATAIEDELQQWVAQLRERTITWARIGAALGMTRQAAWERFNANPTASGA